MKIKILTLCFLLICGTVYAGTTDKLKSVIARMNAEISDTISINTGKALSTNLSLALVFKDGTGSTTVTDLTSNDNDGTLTNIDEDTDWTATSHGGLDFNETNSYVAHSTMFLDNTVDQFSMMIFFNPGSVTGQQSLITHENSSNWRSNLYINGSDVGFATRKDGSTTLDNYSVSSVVTISTDTKIIVTMDMNSGTDEKKIYVDGTLEGTQTPTAHTDGTISGGNTAWIGYNADTEELDGEIYAVYIWTGRILSQADVTALEADAYAMINGVSE